MKERLKRGLLWLTTAFSMTQLNPLQVLAASGQEVAPYMNFASYHYVGANGQEARNVFREYGPDANGIFQVSVVEGAAVNCFVFQIKEDGIYEIAKFDGYQDVSDKRYSRETQNSQQSLVLPLSLTKGTTFLTGYDQSEKNTVMEETMTYRVNQKTFEQVVKVKREASGKVTYRYYAPNVGLIAVEDSENNPLLLLSEAQGKTVK